MEYSLDNISKGFRNVSKFVEKNLINVLFAHYYFRVGFVTVRLVFPLMWLGSYLDSFLIDKFLIFCQDRLIALDAAEEFFKIASRTYPKKPGAPCLADGQKGLHYLPFPSP